jgi:hypothetical protein
VAGQLDLIRDATLRGAAMRRPRALLLARAAARWRALDVLAGSGPGARSAGEALRGAADRDPPEILRPLIEAAWAAMDEVSRQGVPGAGGGG